ncbi:cobalt-precorrin 5A hydrolase [Blautia schinkii]|nr:cobalt-precorrin 5A hydrolase [Blautia schinkii]
MKISMICFSLTGQETGERLADGLKALGYEVSLAKKSKYLLDSVSVSTGEWAGEQFNKADGIIFIGACGIAVRSIAPYIVGKKTDPAVLVVDECGKFVISLLSGHLGGANALTAQAAEILGAAPVITTATDLHQRFAVDVFAKENQCSIFHMKAAKEVSAALLANKEVGFYSEFPWEGELPRGLVACDRNGNRKNKELSGGPKPYDRNENAENGETNKLSGSHAASCGNADAIVRQQSRLVVGIAVTIHKDCLPFPSTVQVVPSVAVLGLGCRKGMGYAQIREAAEQSLDKLSLYREAVHCLASIDLKKEEPGILTLAEAWNVPFKTFSEEELRAVNGSFTPSAFVKQITGVDNVCERSAVLVAESGSITHITEFDSLHHTQRGGLNHAGQEYLMHAGQGGRLIQKKSAAAGVTTAVALRDWRIRFE